MLERWTGDVVGTMHVYGISSKDLADKLGWNSKYLSAVLNGHRKPTGAEQKIRSALDDCIRNQPRSITFTSIYKG